MAMNQLKEAQFLLACLGAPSSSPYRLNPTDFAQHKSSCAPVIKGISEKAARLGPIVRKSLMEWLWNGGGTMGTPLFPCNGKTLVAATGPCSADLLKGKKMPSQPFFGSAQFPNPTPQELQDVVTEVRKRAEELKTEAPAGNPAMGYMITGSKLSAQARATYMQSIEEMPLLTYLTDYQAPQSSPSAKTSWVQALQKIEKNALDLVSKDEGGKLTTYDLGKLTPLIQKAVLQYPKLCEAAYGLMEETQETTARNNTIKGVEAGGLFAGCAITGWTGYGTSLCFLGGALLTYQAVDESIKDTSSKEDLAFSRVVDGIKLGNLDDTIRAQNEELQSIGFAPLALLGGGAAAREVSVVTKAALRGTAAIGRAASEGKAALQAGEIANEASQAHTVAASLSVPKDFTFVNDGPKVARETFHDAWKAKFPSAKPGSRVPLDLSMATSESPWTIKLKPEDQQAVEKWAKQVLAAAQKAHPGKKLKIKKVDFGIGFTAGGNGSLIHADNGGTYLHAISTLSGGPSTIMFTESGDAALKAAKAAAKTKHDVAEVFAYIVGRNPDGSMQVELRSGSQLFETIQLPPSAYVQPPSGTTVILSGADHANEVAEVNAGIHASPHSSEFETPWDRVSLFISIVPE